MPAYVVYKVNNWTSYITKQRKMCKRIDLMYSPITNETVDVSFFTFWKHRSIIVSSVFSMLFGFIVWAFEEQINRMGLTVMMSIYATYMGIFAVTIYYSMKE